MRSALNGNTFFATVAMARQASSSLILVVEGDDDHLLVARHANERNMILIHGVGGRPSVLAAAHRAVDSGLGGVRFLIDVDYDPYIDNSHPYPPNVIASRSHDAMMDVITVNPTLIDRIIDAHGRTARRRGSEFDTANIRSEAFNLALSVAFLRVVNARHSYELRLESFPFGALPDSNFGFIEIARLAVARSRSCVTPEEVADEMNSLTSGIGSPEALMVGDHDFFGALSKILRSHNVRVGSDDLWTSFLAAVACEDLEEVDWYQSVVRWGRSHSRDTFSCPCRK